MNTTHSNIVEKLALQVDSFQEGFEILSESKSINEMAKQFAVLLRGNFLVTDVNLFYKKVSDSAWQMMYGKKEKNTECLITNNSSRMQIEYDLNEDVKACANLPLIDNSVFGITVGAKLDKSDFTEFDKITLQIFLQLLDNAYQSFLNRQKEKELIFELNQRVLQLNNLIDTGIDLSKFLNADIVDRIRGLIPKSSGPLPKPAKTSTANGTEPLQVLNAYYEADKESGEKLLVEELNI
ncbi:MAG: hypothetical protein IIC76_15850 [Bacteroidetes bacterium]|nr:hypothetical protein [Bacteroidota bacterium]